MSLGSRRDARGRLSGHEEGGEEEEETEEEEANEEEEEELACLSRLELMRVVKTLRGEQEALREELVRLRLIKQTRTSRTEDI